MCPCPRFPNEVSPNSLDALHVARCGLCNCTPSRSLFLRMRRPLLRRMATLRIVILGYGVQLLDSADWRICLVFFSIFQRCETLASLTPGPLGFWTSADCLAWCEAQQHSVSCTWSWRRNYKLLRGLSFQMVWFVLAFAVTLETSC